MASCLMFLSFHSSSNLVKVVLVLGGCLLDLSTLGLWVLHSLSPLWLVSLVLVELSLVRLSLVRLSLVKLSLVKLGHWTWVLSAPSSPSSLLTTLSC